MSSLLSRLRKILLTTVSSGTSFCLKHYLIKNWICFLSDDLTFGQLVLVMFHTGSEINFYSSWHVGEIVLEKYMSLKEEARDFSETGEGSQAWTAANFESAAQTCCLPFSTCDLRCPQLSSVDEIDRGERQTETDWVNATTFALLTLGHR